MPRVPPNTVTESEPTLAVTDTDTDTDTASAGGTASASPNAATEATGPEIRVVHGSPTAEELAAVVTVLAAVSVAASPSRSSNDRESGGLRGGWTARERGVRAPLRNGPGGWRASAFPPAR